MAQSLHHSDILPDDRDELQAQLPELADTYRFDALIREVIFGLDIVRFDVYTVTGERIYTSITGSIPENAPASKAFIEARRGIPTSAIRNGVPITGSVGQPKNAQVPTTLGLMEDQAPDETQTGDHWQFWLSTVRWASACGGYAQRCGTSLASSSGVWL